MENTAGPWRCLLGECDGSARRARSWISWRSRVCASVAGWLLPKAALIGSCQRNRGNFCLINDIGFDIFPRSRLPPSRSDANAKGGGGPVVHLWHRNSFSRVRVPTSFTIIVAENLAGGNLRLRALRTRKRRRSSSAAAAAASTTAVQVVVVVTGGASVMRKIPGAVALLRSV